MAGHHKAAFAVLAFGVMLALLNVGAPAQSKTERDLVDRIMRLEAAKRTADRERAQMDEKIAQASRTATANRVAAGKKTDSAETTNADATAKAAEGAKESAGRAEALAKKIVAATETQNNTQYWIVIGIVVTGLFTLLERRAVRKALKEDREAARIDREHVTATLEGQDAQLEQIHTLVNNNLTVSMQEQLDARHEILVLLQAAAEGKLVSPEGRAAIQQAKFRIAELEAQLADRLRQTKEASAAMARSKAKASALVAARKAPVVVRDAV